MAGPLPLRGLYAAFIFLLAAATASALPAQDSSSGQNTTSGPIKIRIPSGFSRALFQDDFSDQRSGGLPSKAKWAVDTGTSYPGGPARWGTNEVQTYTTSGANLAISSAGTLQITPVVSSGRWTSARIETTASQDFSCGAGRRLRMEASLRLGAAASSSQAGIWPAFWALGSSYRGSYHNWPAVGEIDILEALNGQPTAYQTLHCGSGSGGPCHETTGITATAALSRGEWHVVAVEIDRTNAGGDWRGEKITWFVDGRPTTSVSGAVVGDAVAWSALARSDKFLILNVAVGGDFPSAVAKGTTPNAQTKGGSGAAMEVQYVAVFSS